MTINIDSCMICGCHDHVEVYKGDIRDGTFGSYEHDAGVLECSCCGVQRLEEKHCLNDAHYETEAYRKKLKQGLDTNSYFITHDKLQIFTLKNLWPNSVRGKIVADIGCGGGSLLDQVSGLADEIIAVEPSKIYHPGLSERGYKVYSYATEVSSEYKKNIDIVFSSYVVEHTENPKSYLEDIRELLCDDGLLILSTPNRNDILMNLMPDYYKSFFYRVVHRWYFDMSSLIMCAVNAGYEVVGEYYVHRYGLANTMQWLRDRKPCGNTRLECIDEVADAMWENYLVTSGQSDSIYLHLRPAR